jgi:hypothetical protein
LTKRFLPALATAVVTTKMINSQDQGSPETPPLMVVLVASSAGQSAPATPVNLGRPAECGEQPTRIRRRSEVAVVSGAALSLLIIELVPGSNSC